MLNFVKSVAELLNKNKIDYLVVGGVAKVLHKQSWIPSDLDILVYNDHNNLINLNRILKNDKMIFDLKHEKIVRIIGKPFCIDFHTKLNGLNLLEVKKRKEQILLGETTINLINEEDLKSNLLSVQATINRIINI